MTRDTFHRLVQRVPLAHERHARAIQDALEDRGHYASECGHALVQPGFDLNWRCTVFLDGQPIAHTESAILDVVINYAITIDSRGAARARALEGL